MEKKYLYASEFFLEKFKFKFYFFQNFIHENRIYSPIIKPIISSLPTSTPPMSPSFPFKSMTSSFVIIIVLHTCTHPHTLVFMYMYAGLTSIDERHRQSMPDERGRISLLLDDLPSLIGYLTLVVNHRRLFDSDF